MSPQITPAEGDWLIDYRAGRLPTPFRHFAVVADGSVGELQYGFECPPGRACMGMRVWAHVEEEALHMARVIGADIGFEIDARLEAYETEPEQPPRDKGFAYAIAFEPYEE